MEAAPHSPASGLESGSDSGSDKPGSKSESSGNKKRDTSTAAINVAETLFNAKAPEESAKKETFWERIGGDKDTTSEDADDEVHLIPETSSEALLIDAAREHIAERQAEVHAELAGTDPQSVEAVAAASDAALLEHANEQIAQSDNADTVPMTPSEAIDAAYAQTVRDIDEAVAHAHQEAQDTLPQHPAVPEFAYPAPEVPVVPADVLQQPQVAAANIAAPVAVGSTMPETFTERDTQKAESAAYVQGRSEGLITGGFLGYLYGRHRGRKRAEKRARPVRERLEKQLKQVTQKLTNHEKNIRTLAQQKATEAPQPLRYDKVVERLAPVSVLPEQRTMPLQELGRPAAAVPLEAPVRQPRAEVPVVAKKPEELAVSRSEYAGIVPFNTPVEQLSGNELQAIAEKVVIDHVSLKQMYQAEQFDEKALRRIVNEFLRGGDVQRAVTNEVLRKDKTFELDPRLRRQAQASNAVEGGGAAGTINGQYRDLPSDGQAVERHVPAKHSKQSPELSQTAMHDLKVRQAMSIAGVTALVIIAIIFAIIITS